MINKYLLLITIVFSTLLIKSQPVGIETVKQVAINAFYNNTGKKNIEIRDIIPVKDNKENELFYIINFKNNGFAIISAEKAMKAVLGTCSKNNFKYEDVPPGLLYLLDKYKTEIIELRRQKILPSNKDISMWNKYNVQLGKFLKTENVKTVSSMTTTTWGQSSGYNRFCPLDKSGDRCVAGCVAIAMAQVLHYWNCWVGETGSHSYWWTYNWNTQILLNADFENADYQWSSMGTSWADDENAKLIYHCGVACEMDYDDKGSTTMPWDAKEALKDYFGFASSIDLKWRIYNLQHWQSMLEGQLDNGWPVIYSGGKTFGGGHTWVIDGYNSDGEFECNWGWYGSYNGAYALGDFDNPVGSFNQYESAIFNAWPTRSTRVGQPNINSQYIYSGNNTLTIANVEPTSGYEWTTNHGIITGNSTLAILNTNATSHVCVRGVNDQCDIHSNWNCATMTICNQTNISNKVFTNNTNYSNCSINLTNCSIKNGAKLTLNAYNKTTINGPFEVKLGSRLEVK